MAGFETPVSARQWCREHDLDFRSLPDRQRFDQTRHFTDHLMSRIKRAMPVLPVSMVCTALLDRPNATWNRESLQDGYRELVGVLEAGLRGGES